MTTTVLVTGVGGPAGISVVRSLLARSDTRVIAADMDRFASGLYLVPPEQRVLIPPGLSGELVPVLLEWCRSLGVDVLFPTVDVALGQPAQRSARDSLSRQISRVDRLGDATATPIAENLFLSVAMVEKTKLGKVLSPALIYLVGYGPLLCAITFDSYIKEFKGAAQVWDKTGKVGKVMA